jgi:hypothetical protein
MQASLSTVRKRCPTIQCCPRRLLNLYFDPISSTHRGISLPTTLSGPATTYMSDGCERHFACSGRAIRLLLRVWNSPTGRRSEWQRHLCRLHVRRPLSYHTTFGRCRSFRRPSAPNLGGSTSEPSWYIASQPNTSALLDTTDWRAGCAVAAHGRLGATALLSSRPNWRGEGLNRVHGAVLRQSEGMCYGDES